MSEEPYAVKNLTEIDDATGDREGIEGRFARKFLGSRELGVSLFRYAPDYAATTGHRHREQEEAYVVVSGSGRMRLDDDVIDLSRWDVVRVAPQVTRAFQAGPEGLEVIAVGGAKPEGGDGEPIEDFWVEG